MNINDQYILYDEPEVFQHGDFVIRIKELLFNSKLDPPIDVQTPLSDGKPEEILTSFEFQLKTIKDAYLEFQKLTKAEYRKLNGKTTYDVNEYFTTESREEVVKAELSLNKHKLKLEDELFLFCEKANRKEIIKAKALLVDQEAFERSFGTNQDINLRIKFTREVIGEYFKWYVKHDYQFPITIEENKKGLTQQSGEIDLKNIEKSILEKAKKEAYKRCQEYLNIHPKKKSAPMEICRKVVEEFFPIVKDKEKTRLAKTIRTSVNSKKKPPRKKTIRRYSNN